MKYSNIKTFDIANGTGIRISLFVSGCNHHCNGCFQPETWDFNYGRDFNQETIDYIINESSNERISGLTLLGGEPFEIENQRELIKLLRAYKEKFPQKDIWAFTGFIYEKDILEKSGIAHCEVTDEILEYVDILVDGPFILEKKDLKLKFRGSSNQRMINLKTGEIS